MSASGRANLGPDGDKIYNGTEAGFTFGLITPGTSVAAGNFVPDAEPTSRTSHISVDSDGDLLPDGWVDGKFINPATPTALSSPLGLYDAESAGANLDETV